MGFSEYCAETRAYNGEHTKRRCIGICLKDYGLINIMTNGMDKSNVDKDGNLKPRIACDNMVCQV